jgi:hypothetical protein
MTVWMTLVKVILNLLVGLHGENVIASFAPDEET